MDTAAATRSGRRVRLNENFNVAFNLQINDIKLSDRRLRVDAA